MDEQKEKKLQMPCEPTLARAPALGHPNYKLPFPSLCLKTEDTSWVYSLRGTVTTGCYSCQLDLVAEGLPPSRRAISATALFMQSYWRNFSWGLLSESLDLLRSIVTLITQYYFRLLVLTALTLQLCFQHLKMTALYWLSSNWGLMCKKFPLIILDLIWFTGGSYFKGHYWAGFAITSTVEISESSYLPDTKSAQQAELIAWRGLVN